MPAGRVLSVAAGAGTAAGEASGPGTQGERYTWAGARHFGGAGRVSILGRIAAGTVAAACARGAHGRDPAGARFQPPRHRRVSSEQSDMTERREDDLLEKAHEWWRTAIIDIHPGSIGIRGFPIQELIGKLSFVEMIWLMVRGELPAPSHARLLEAALVASVDHGPHAPSISIARMAVTCGVDLNNAMASGINVLGDVHGGPGQQCMRLYELIAHEPLNGRSLASATDHVLDAFIAAEGQIIPGFGHRFHPVDPRVAPLLGLVQERATGGSVSGRYAVDRPRGGSSPSAPHRQTDTHEYRWSDRRHFLRAGISTGDGSRSFHLVALGGDPLSRVGTDAAQGTHQGTDAERDSITPTTDPRRARLHRADASAAPAGQTQQVKPSRSNFGEQS